VQRCCSGVDRQQPTFSAPWIMSPAHENALYAAASCPQRAARLKPQLHHRALLAAGVFACGSRRNTLPHATRRASVARPNGFTSRPTPGPRARFAIPTLRGPQRAPIFVERSQWTESRPY
jgi:hypothetical protein